MSKRPGDVLRPPIATRPNRVDPRAEPDEPSSRDLQMACLARIALVQRRVVVEPEERPALDAPRPRPDSLRPSRPAPRQGVWCFRPGDDSAEVVELPDDT